MAIEVTKTASATMTFEGTKTETSHTSVKLRCDGPKCGNYQAYNGCKYEISWEEEKPEEVPDEAFRVMVHQDGLNTQPKHFFSRNCLKEYMRDVYVPPLSPKEQAAKMQAEHGGTVVAVPEVGPPSRPVQASLDETDGA